MKKRMLSSAGLLIAGFCVVYIFSCGYLYLNQDRYIYFPDKVIRATPMSHGTPFEDSKVITSDMITVNYWFIPAKEEKGAVIFCHGNGGNLGDRVEKYLLLRELGLTVFALEYRGYGKSGGEPSEEGFYRDVDALISEAEKRGYGQDDIFLYGESIGGAVAAFAASKRVAAGLILESSFTTAVEMARHYYPFFPLKLILKPDFDTLGTLRSVRCPVIILHSPDDEIVPYSMCLELYEAAGAPKYFSKLRGGHNDGGILISGEAKKELEKFIGAACKRN